MKARAAVVGLLMLAAFAAAWWADVLAPAAVAPDGATPSDGAVSIRAATPEEPHAAAETFATERRAASERSTARAVRITTVGPDGEPIAGAEVRYWPVRSQMERERDSKLYDHIDDAEAALRAGGRVAITDAQGVVAIEGDEGHMVCARSGELYAEGNLGDSRDAFADELRLELQRDMTLRIEVVDTNGTPLVGRKVHVDTHCVSRRSGIHQTNAEIGPTDADGRIVLPHAFAHLECDAAAAHGVIEFQVRQPTPNRGPLVHHELGWHQLRPVTEVRLVLPAGGAIVVSATDADGAAMTPWCWLEDEQREQFALAWLDDEGRRWWFRDVPLGRRWHVRASWGTVEHRVAVTGPRTAGEVVPLDLRLPVRRFELRGQVTRRDGAPLANADVRVRCAAASMDGVFLRTPHDGTIPFGIHYVPVAIDNLAPIELFVSGRGCTPGTFVVHRAIGPGATDLGTFVVEPPAGEALLARLELRSEGEPARDGGWAMLSTGKGDTHRSCAFGYTRGGVVELRGTIPDQPMLLSCGAPDCGEVRNVPVRPGEHRVIELQRAAALRAAMVVPDGPRGQIRATLTAAGDDQVEEGFDPMQQIAVFHGMAPGRYRLCIFAGTLLLHEEPEITLQPGNNRWPADGSRLDLRARVQARGLVARDAMRDRLVSVEAIQVPAGATELPAAAERHVRDSWFVLGQQATDLLVRAEGYVPVRVGNPTGDVVLHLQPSTWGSLEVVDENDATVRMRIVDDAVQDPLLRAFDEHNMHTPAQEFAAGDAPYLSFAPGTIVEFTLLRGGKAGPPLRVAITDTEVQGVQLR